MLTSCASTAVDDPLADHSFITQQPCAAPCWYGLELDKSSKDDVYTTLQRLPFIDQNTIKEWNTGWLNDETAVEVHFSCLHPNVRSCGEALVSQGKLKQLHMFIGYQLTFETVVQELGIPGYVSDVPNNAEVGGCEVSLYWPILWIEVASNSKQDQSCVKNGIGAGVDPKSTVTAIVYQVPEGFEPTAKLGPSFAPWPGFVKP